MGGLKFSSVVHGGDCGLHIFSIVSVCQGVVLQLLAAVGVIRTEHIWLEINQIEEAYQNLFVCVEMVMFAVLQQYAFSAGEYSGEVEKLLLDAKKRREEKVD